MNLAKSTKRIAKRVKNGFQGYPQINLAYHGKTTDYATQVVVTLLCEEGAEPQSQTFTSSTNVKKDETIQTTLLKVIERSDAKTVAEVEGILPIALNN